MTTAKDLVLLCCDLMTQAQFINAFQGSTTAKAQRELIRYTAPDDAPKISLRESMRIYIARQRGLSMKVSDTSPEYSLAEMIAASDKLAYPHLQTTTSTPSPLPKAPTMKTKAIVISTQININGQNIVDYKDADLFNMIAQQEAEIKSLNELQNKPQSLLAEIKKRQEGIDAVVNYMNERDAKANPQPVQPTEQPLALPDTI